MKTERKHLFNNLQDPLKYHDIVNTLQINLAYKFKIGIYLYVHEH